MIPLIRRSTESENYFNTVKSSIKIRIDNILKSGIKRNKIAVPITPTLRAYLKHLSVEANLKTLILANPVDLIPIINHHKVHNKDFLNTKGDSFFILNNIFISNGYNKLNKLELIKYIDIDTCPYCNRNYIYHLTAKNKIKPQIDHFYPQSKYPFFGLSFYNLIPSCQTCNGLEVKAANDPYKLGFINPYLLNHSDFKFTYDIKNINFINPLIDKNSVDVRFINKIQSHLDLFKLDKLYELHSDHVLELIVKSQLEYSPKYRDYLNSYENLKFSDKEINRLILGNYSEESEIHKRPLAKLYQDIGKELGLIS